MVGLLRQLFAANDSGHILGYLVGSVKQRTSFARAIAVCLCAMFHVKNFNEFS